MKKSIATAAVSLGATIMGHVGALAAEHDTHMEPSTAIPDRVSLDPTSPHFWPEYRKLGVRINGEQRPGDVHEFCVSEGWAMVRSKTPEGRYRHDGHTILLDRIEGHIEPFIRKPLKGPPGDADKAALAAAEAKRARKAARRIA